MWARVDDGFWCHPKVMALPGSACGLWVRALSWSCAQRSAVVPSHFLAMVGHSPADAAALVDAGLWLPADDGWEIHDWSEYQDLSTSERRAEAGRKGGKRSGEARRSKPKQTPDLTSGNAEANPKQTEARPEAGPSLPVPSHPDPSPTHISPLLTVVAPGPALDVEQIEQRTNRAVGLLANLRAIGGDNPGALARHIGENLPDHERAELRELVAAGTDPKDAAHALADPLRGLVPSGVGALDPEAVKAAAARAKRREAETLERIESMGSIKPARMPASVRSALGEAR